MNIGLNNFSLSLLAISTNLIIRSCLPLTTALAQIVLHKCGFAGGSVRTVELAIMLMAVFFAAVATIAKAQSSGGTTESAHLMLGSICCVLANLCASMNLVLA